MNCEELIRCLRDCWDDSTGPSCDCDHCLFRDKIVDDVGYTDYTKCETAMVLAAADAIEELDTLLDGVSADNEALCETIEMLKKQAFDMSSLIGDYSEKTRWIPVTERLPEYGKHVLVYVGFFQPYIEAAYYCEDRKWRFAYDDAEVVGVSHWMLLPTPPKEEAQ